MLEKELKVLLTNEQFNKISNYWKWNKSYEQINYYYTDKNGIVQQKNITVRVRDKNGEYILQVKVPYETCDSIKISEEFEKKVEKVYKKISPDEIYQLTHIQLPELYLIGKLKTYRKENTNYKGCTICLDKNKYGNKVDNELEIEYVDSLEPQILIILREMQIKYEEKCDGKFTRFMAHFNKTEC